MIVLVGKMKFTNPFDRRKVARDRAGHHVTREERLFQWRLRFSEHIFGHAQKPLRIIRVVPFESISIAAPAVDQQNVFGVNVSVNDHAKRLLTDCSDIRQLTGQKHPVFRVCVKIGGVTVQDLRSIVLWVDRYGHKRHFRITNSFSQRFDLGVQVTTNPWALSKKETDHIRASGKFRRIKFLVVLIGQSKRRDVLAMFPGKLPVRSPFLGLDRKRILGRQV